MSIRGITGLRSSKATKGKIGLIGHVVADFPDPAAARQMIKNMVGAGVAIIEVQIPFSEPVADGPVFMAANHYALEHGVSVTDAFALVHEVAFAYPATDFVFMTYLNIVYKAGYAEFAKKSAQAGVRAVIIPDLPIENSGPADREFLKFGIDNIRLVAPNTTDERLAIICKNARGLIYAVARSGVTGTATAINTELAMYTKRISGNTATPIGLGFGIRTPDDMIRLNGVADYAIIGTAALQAWQTGGDVTHREFWSKISKAAFVL